MSETEVVSVRLAKPDLDRIDQISKQHGQCGRNAVIRMLVGDGLRRLPHGSKRRIRAYLRKPIVRVK